MSLRGKVYVPSWKSLCPFVEKSMSFKPQNRCTATVLGLLNQEDKSRSKSSYLSREKIKGCGLWITPQTANLRAARVSPGCSFIFQSLSSWGALSSPGVASARLQARPGTAHATAESSQRRLYKGPTDQPASADPSPVPLIDQS